MFVRLQGGKWLMTLPVLYSCDKGSPRQSITESKLEINTRHHWVMELGPLGFLAQSQTQMNQKVRWLEKHKEIWLCETEQYLSFVFMSLIKYSFLSLLHKLLGNGFHSWWFSFSTEIRSMANLRLHSLDNCTCQKNVLLEFLSFEFAQSQIGILRFFRQNSVNAALDITHFKGKVCGDPGGMQCLCKLDRLWPALCHLTRHARDDSVGTLHPNESLTTDP